MMKMIPRDQKLSDHSLIQMSCLFLLEDLEDQ